MSQLGPGHGPFPRVTRLEQRCQAFRLQIPEAPATLDPLPNFDKIQNKSRQLCPYLFAGQSVWPVSVLQRLCAHSPNIALDYLCCIPAPFHLPDADYPAATSLVMRMLLEVRSPNSSRSLFLICP